MLPKSFYKSEVITCTPETSIQEVARLMKENSVGNVVVVQANDGIAKPLGVVTDRDIVLGAICEKIDSIATMTASDLMSPDVILINQDMSVFEALDCLREGGVSRAPVVDEKGQLCGVLSSSRIFKILSEQLVKLSDLSDQRKEFPEQAKRIPKEKSSQNFDQQRH